ncbi:MAG: DUF4445 domain-containing protein [Dehalococcoidia bacterium]|nr:MAG: DUF4445 domain-containing protein [Dehalococcoidia bacterium]
MACSTIVLGDVVVFVPEMSRREKHVIRKSTVERVIPVKPAIRKYYLELSPPTLNALAADYQRLAAELGHSFGLRIEGIDYAALSNLASVLREGDWKVTVTVWMSREIAKVEPGYIDGSYGLAVDIGTTTVAGYLCDLQTGEVLATEAILNPQVAYGEDVISRINYAVTEPDGLATLNRAIVDGIGKIIASITRKAQLVPGDISEMTVAGNSAMHHIFLNLNPEYLSKSPFVPTIAKSLDIKSRDLGIGLDKSANVHILPVEAGFVGADNVGVLIAEEPYNQDEMVLIIDIGTNGELVMGNREKLLCASCAMGPAFEGANIKFGMRAAPGAIECVTIDRQSLEVKFKVIGSDEWSTASSSVKAKGICGSGIVDAIAEMVKAGIIEESGRFNRKLASPRFSITDEGPAFVIAWASEASLGRDITVSIDDVRAVQLAKGAMYAGVRILMEKLGVTELDKVILAGAFGSYINKENALAIGLFPDCALERVYSVGNAAGEGARLALISLDKRREAEEIARKVEYVELTVEPEFQKYFVDALHFPIPNELNNP